MATDERQPPQETALDLITFADFLESFPPAREAHLAKFATLSGTNRITEGGMIRGWKAQPPTITLYCEDCRGPRFYDCNYGAISFGDTGEWKDVFLTYICRNCRTSEKLYAISIVVTSKNGGGAIKLGEWPPFGKLVPPRLRELIKKDWDLFFKGWQAEQQRLGIAAFSYYRRVLENQKERLIDEIIKASKKLAAPAEVIAKFENAKKEDQFSKAIGNIKDVLPNGLLIDGNNPLTLLYGALSKGVHELSDEECLKRSQHIVKILGALADRLQHITEEHAELKEAISALMPKT